MLGVVKVVAVTVGDQVTNPIYRSTNSICRNTNPIFVLELYRVAGGRQAAVRHGCDEDVEQSFQRGERRGDLFVFVFVLRATCYVEALRCTLRTTLYCTTQYCTTLYCTTLYCSALHCTAQHPFLPQMTDGGEGGGSAANSWPWTTCWPERWGRKGCPPPPLTPTTPGQLDGCQPKDCEIAAYFTHCNLQPVHQVRRDRSCTL